MWNRLRARRPTARLRSVDLDAPATRPPRRTLADDAAEDQLVRRGFTAVPLLARSEVEDLRAGYARLAHDHTRDSPFAEGFHTSVYDGRPEYRQAVDDMVVGALGPALGRVLDDHRLIFANFTVKLDHGGPVPLHPDWTFVDEGRYRSVTVWCALDDLSFEDGTLGIVAESHHQVGFVRPLNIRSYERYQTIAEASGSHDVTALRAGEAIVMDSRAVHFSPPNVTARDRVVAACVAIPAEADIEHYFVEDDGAVWRHTIDRSFYFHYQAGSDPHGVPGCGPRSPAGPVEVA